MAMGDPAEGKERPRPIAAVADELGLAADEWEPYGAQVAKVGLPLLERLSGRRQGRYIMVTATTPTRHGEGKTVVCIGLAQALRRLGKRVVATLREPSLGPFLGLKGGATGGGRSSLVPADRINMHFTGDLHAVTTAHNLLAALLDNHLHRGNALGLGVDDIFWRRVLDLGDRSLRQVVTGLGGRGNGVPRETGLDITATSEVMGILALASDLRDLRRRLGEIRVGADGQGRLVRAEELEAAGAMARMLQDAMAPNLVQTAEGGPCLVHAGPFANISIGTSSVVADRMALGLADFVVTEAGFGADCGAEKMIHIKCAQSGLRPSLAVLVTTVRALKHHSGLSRAASDGAGVEAVHAGCGNLAHHISILRHFGLPVVVAVNRVPGDTDAECQVALDEAAKEGAVDAVTVDVFARGGAGGMDLARAVAEFSGRVPELRPCYEPDDPLEDKIASLARKVYGAGEVELSRLARRKLALLEANDLAGLPVCMAKTPLSLSHDPSLMGTPRGFTLPVSDLRPAAGAGYITALTGEIYTMPGLPARPAACDMDLDEEVLRERAQAGGVH